MNQYYCILLPSEIEAYHILLFLGKFKESCSNIPCENVAKNPHSQPSSQMSVKNVSVQPLTAERKNQDKNGIKPTMCFDDYYCHEECPCSALDPACAHYGPSTVSEPYEPAPEPIEVPGHMNPSIYNEISRFGNPMPTRFMTLPREVRIIIYSYMFIGKVYSNDVQGLGYTQIYKNGRHKNGERILPLSLSILFVCRLINLLYHDSGCTFRLHVEDFVMSDRYSKPLATQRTISLVENLEIVLRPKVYAELAATTKDKWKDQLANFSQGSRGSCRTILQCPSSRPDHGIFASYDSDSLVFPKGIMRLLKLPRGFKTVEVILRPDIAPYHGDLWYRFTVERVDWGWRPENEGKLENLKKGLEGVLGKGKWVEEKVEEQVKDRLIFHPPQL